MTQLYEFEFDEKKLGKDWFNIFNLELCLFSKERTKTALLKVREMENPDPEKIIKEEIDETSVIDEAKKFRKKGGNMKENEVLATITKEEVTELDEIIKQRTAAKKVADDLIKSLIDVESQFSEQEKNWWVRIREKYNLPLIEDIVRQGLTIEASPFTKEIRLVVRRQSRF
jgi:hypothetical protein